MAKTYDWTSPAEFLGYIVPKAQTEKLVSTKKRTEEKREARITFLVFLKPKTN
jgi:hypothetical protein